MTTFRICETPSQTTPSHFTSKNYIRLLNCAVEEIRDCKTINPADLKTFLTTMEQMKNFPHLREVICLYCAHVLQLWALEVKQNNNGQNVHKHNPSHLLSMTFLYWHFEFIYSHYSDDCKDESNKKFPLGPFRRIVFKNIRKSTKK